MRGFNRESEIGNRKSHFNAPQRDARGTPSKIAWERPAGIMAAATAALPGWNYMPAESATGNYFPAA